MQASRDIGRLVDIMRALRTPHTGCPWDLEQSFDSIVPYTVEETFEVVDAIERRDAEDLCEELGDLLLQVVYYCQLAEEEGLFTLGDVVEGITGKMIRRHPHVFGDAEARSAGSAKGQWNRIKAEEKALRAERRAARTASSASGEWAPKPVPETAGLLDAVPGALPSLALATKVQEKAANVGFDWKTPEPIIAKIREEIAEFEEAQDAADPIAQEDELGDIVYVELPEEGEEVEKGDMLGVIESVKAVSDLYAPVSGTISKVNREIESEPGLLNEKPFGDGWIAVIEFSDKSEVDALMSAEEYEEEID